LIWLAAASAFIDPYHHAKAGVDVLMLDKYHFPRDNHAGWHVQSIHRVKAMGVYERREIAYKCPVR
jgi:hypothetical protein